MAPADVTLVQAAVMLGKSYNQTLRLVLIGEIHAEQRNGRWFLDSSDVVRLKNSHNHGIAAQT